MRPLGASLPQMFARPPLGQRWTVCGSILALCVAAGCTPVEDWLEGLGVEDETGTGDESGEDPSGQDESDSEGSSEESLLDELPSDEDWEQLDCTVAMDSDFCWYEFARSAASCLAKSQGPGEFDAARETCSFEDGASVEFGSPVPDSDLDDFEWNFSVRDDGGDECLRVEDDSAQYDGWSLRLTHDGETGELMKVGRAQRIKCPNGKIYRSRDDEWIDDCAGVAPKFRAWTIASDHLTAFELTAQPDAAQIFECVGS